MNKNDTLLESLVLLAILKRKRDRERNKSKKTTYNNPKKSINIHEDDSNENYDQDVLNYNSDDSNKTITNSCNAENNNGVQETKEIITYCFDKETNTLQKVLISKDNKEFKNVKDLTNSIINRRVVCDICGKTFNEKNLKFHMNKHNNNFPFKCTIDNCKRAFTSAQMLKQHQKFHCKIKRLKCEFCDRSFYMPNSLRNHRLLHFDPTVECEKCGKMLHSKNALKIHEEKIHLRIKKYVCNVCDKRYINHGSLRKHLTVVHNQKFTSQRIAR